LTPCLHLSLHPPKYECFQRLAERIGARDLDRGALEAYLVLMSVTEEMRETGNAWLSCHGLGEGRITVLVLLLEKQLEPLSHSQLADLMGVTRGSITGLVDGLENDGLVRRCEACEDRRTRLIAITPAGRDLVATYLPEKLHWIERLMAALSPAEGETLASLLLKLHQGLPAQPSE